MDFDALVDRLLSQFDVGQQRCVDVANERLTQLMADSEGVQTILGIDQTVAGQSRYDLEPSVVKILKIRVDYPDGSIAIHEGTATMEDFWDLDAGRVEAHGKYFVIEPQFTGLIVTDQLRLYPTPDVDGGAIVALVALMAPVALEYGTSAILPLPTDIQPALLAGCMASLYDEEDRQDESAKAETVFAAGIRELTARVTSRATGSGSHRLRKSGYDFGRR